MTSLFLAVVLSSSPLVAHERCFARAVDGGEVEVSSEVCAALKPPTTSARQLECLQLGFVVPPPVRQ